MSAAPPPRIGSPGSPPPATVQRSARAKRRAPADFGGREPDRDKCRGLDSNGAPGAGERPGIGVPLPSVAAASSLHPPPAPGQTGPSGLLGSARPPARLAVPDDELMKMLADLWLGSERDSPAPKRRRSPDLPGDPEFQRPNKHRRIASRTDTPVRAPPPPPPGPRSKRQRSPDALGDPESQRPAKHRSLTDPDGAPVRCPPPAS